MLLGKNGLQLLRILRENNIDSEVIMLTAKSMIDDKLRGFELGANFDFYLKIWYYFACRKGSSNPIWD